MDYCSKKPRPLFLAVKNLGNRVDMQICDPGQLPLLGSLSLSEDLVPFQCAPLPPVLGGGG